MSRQNFYKTHGKRLLDLVVTVPAALILWPLGLVIAAMLRLTDGYPVLFRQSRPGLDGRLFTVFKIRTMSNATDATGVLLPDEERLTRLGRLLRALSLDELPQLINVLRGEMSLIG